MTLIIYWLICSICSFYLLLTYVSSNLRRVGIQDASIATAMRNAAKRDETIDPMHDCPDNIACALFWTVLLVESLLIWPVNLVILLWWQVFDKQDFSGFRGVE